MGQQGRKQTDQPAALGQRIDLDDVSQLTRTRKADDPLPAFKEQLKVYSCLKDWNALVDAGCPEEKLSLFVVAVREAFKHHRRLQDDGARMNARRLRSLVDKTRWVAREWRQVFQSPFGREVLGLAKVGDPFALKEEFLNLPRRLDLLANSAKKIHSGTKHQRRPVYDDALAELTVFVKAHTHKYHDKEVSALVEFARGDRDNYPPTNLSTWRAEHPEAIRCASCRQP